MSAWEHYFRVMINVHDDDLFDIETALRDKFGVEDVEESPGSTDMHRTIWVEFKGQIDPNREPVESFAEKIRMVVYEAAERYPEVSVQGYIIEGGKSYFGSENEFQKMKRKMELEEKKSTCRRLIKRRSPMR